MDISIPKNKLIVATGVSGSGKSSLMFDIIFEEGHSQYLKSVGILSGICDLENDDDQIDESEDSESEDSESVETIAEKLEGMESLVQKINSYLFCTLLYDSIEKHVLRIYLH